MFNLNSLLVFLPFIFFSIVGVVLAISSSSPFLMWMGMEISTFFFIPLFFSLPSSQVNGWKYFLTQVISSFFFFIGWVIDEMSSSVDSFLIFISLIIKLGGFPFFGWVIHLSENLSWWSFFLLGTLQKIVPLVFMSKLKDEMSFFTNLMVMIMMIMLIFFFFSNHSIRWMMMYSSLFNLSWMIMGTSLGLGPFLFYMFVYFLFNFMVIICLSYESSDLFLSSFSTRSVKWEENSLMALSFLMLMGIPPLGTFLGKVEIISLLVLDAMALSLLFVLLTSIIVFFYLKMTYLKGVFSAKNWMEYLSPKWSFSIILLPSILFFMSWI